MVFTGLRPIHGMGVTHDMCKTPPSSPPDELLIQAMVQYLEDSISVEERIRKILASGGFDNPEMSLEECVSALVAHSRQAGDT